MVYRDTREPSQRSHTGVTAGTEPRVENQLNEMKMLLKVLPRVLHLLRQLYLLPPRRTRDRHSHGQKSGEEISPSAHLSSD